MNAEMGAAIFIALVTALGGLLAGHKLNERVRDLERTITRFEVMIDTIWSIYAVDSIKEARSARLVRKNSPLTITGRWTEIVPAAERKSIQATIERLSEELREPYDVAIEVFSEHRPQLERTARLHDIRLQALFGVIYQMCRGGDDE
ncbi:MAG: hypothetical protein L0332_06795 [Chloroflexi bacterium]|nr:hypothetical protein [Chloroflexota bacterium]